MSSRNKFFHLCLVALSMALALPFTASAASDNWPNSPIKILVPFSAGGAADIMARTMAPQIGKQLGVAVVVENTTGGAGAVAMSKLATSKPDGYTLILTSSAPCTLTPNRSDVGYTNKEFAPIAQIVDLPNYVVVHKDSGIKTLPELLEKAEKEKNITYGTAGAGLAQNTQIEALLMAIKKPEILTHVPFDGGSQAVAALLGNQISAAMCVITEVMPHIKSGTFVALATSTARRDKALPDIPTFAELGYPTYGGSWYGFAAPAKTPAPIIKRLSAIVKDTCELPEIIEVFEKIGNPIQYLDDQAFTELWMKAYETNKNIIAELLKQSKK